MIPGIRLWLGVNDPRDKIVVRVNDPRDKIMVRG